MNRSNIEWTEFTLNPIRGKCPHNCWYCYAWPIYQKLGYKEEPVFLSSVLEELKKRKKSSTIFIGSMFDLWANAIPGEWIDEIVEKCRLWRQHIYLFCTKNPARYHNYGFLKHCWYGATVDQDIYGFTEQATELLFPDDKDFNSFISFEPLCAPVDKQDLEYAIGGGLKQIIVGAMTGQGKKNIIPKKEWILDIIEVADKYKVPVFLKDNLLKLYPELPKKRDLAWK